MTRRERLFASGIFLTLLVSDPARAGKIDVHAHAGVNASAYGPSAADVASAMTSQNMDAMILMGTPSSLYGTSMESTDDVYSFFKADPKIYYMYGGSELNYLLHGVGRVSSFAGDPDIGFRWTATTVSALSAYPNGCSGPCSTAILDGLAEGAAIETRGVAGADHTAFISLVTAALTSTTPNYLGFGELSPNHTSQRVGHPYIRFPVDHGWMQELSDLAAPYGKVLDLHVELNATTVPELKSLLNHNTATKILLEHVGWSPNGYATAAVIESLLSAHPNLYIALKKCHPTYVSTGCYIDSVTGAVATDWFALFTNSAYAGRFMVGTDLKFWSDSTPVALELSRNTVDRYADGDGIGTLKILMTELKAYDLDKGTSYWNGIREMNARALFGI